MGYGFTIIGAIFIGVFNALIGMGVTGESVEFARGFFMVVAVILTVIGAIKTLIKGEGWKGKLFGLAIHAAICIGLKILVPIVIAFVAVWAIDHFLLGGVIYTFIHDRFAGVTPEGDMDWPMMVFEAEGIVWNLRHNYGETAVYICDDRGAEISVNKTDVHDNKMRTMYGELHW